MRSLLDGVLDAFKPQDFVQTGAGKKTSMFGWVTQGRNVESQLDAYGSVGTLFAIVNRLSEAVASVQWELWKKSATGKDADRKPVLEHAVLDLWNRPNEFYSGFTLREVGLQHFFLVGEMIFFIEKVAGLPIRLWNIRPDRIEPVPGAKKFLLGWVYHSPDGDKVPIKLDELLFIKNPHPKDPYRGMGVVQALLTDIDTARYSAEWNRNFFINGAEPGGIIEVEKRLSDKEWEEMVQRWRDQHQGVANAHRVAVIEQGQWKDRKYTNNDMQFKELRELSREIIREGFGYPKIMLGTVDDVNRANAEVGEEMFGRWLVTPPLRRLKEEANFKLLPMYSTTKRMEFDHADPVPESREQTAKERDSRAKAADLLVRAGYHGDDVREAVGLPQMKWSKNEIQRQSGGAGSSDKFEED